MILLRLVMGTVQYRVESVEVDSGGKSLVVKGQTQSGVCTNRASRKRKWPSGMPIGPYIPNIGGNLEMKICQVYLTVLSPSALCRAL